MSTAPAIRTRLVYKDREHEYWLDGELIVSCTQVISKYGIGGDMSMIPKAVLERKRQIGTHVDSATQMMLEGTLDEATVAIELQGYLQTFRRFLAAHSFKVETSQLHTFGELYTMYYGVTPDFTGILDGRPAIIDIKCTYDPSPFSWGVQLAAQKNAILQQHPMPDVTDYDLFILWLQKDGQFNEKKHLLKYEDPEHITVFQSGLFIHTQKAKCAKRK